MAHVVLLHGLFRSRFSLWKLQRDLEAKQFTVFNKSYPSTRQSIEEHADTVFEHLQQHYGPNFSEPLNFVTHSLGGIVCRALLAKHADKLPPCHRIVMLAPPNQGVQIVDKLKHLWLFKVVAGQAGLALSQDESGPAERFGRYLLPEGPELGIIAGGKGDADGYAPWLDGDNDGTVEVDATYLSGSNDHILLPHIHTFIMNAQETLENVVHFLEFGRFKEDAQRLPQIAEVS